MNRWQPCADLTLFPKEERKFPYLLELPEDKIQLRKDKELYFLKFRGKKGKHPISLDTQACMPRNASN